MTDLTSDQQATLDRVAKLKPYAKLEWYRPYMANWPKGEAGPKITWQHVKLADLLYAKKRAGFEQGFVAMLLRDSGSTDSEHAAAFNCKTAHNNAWGAVGMTSQGVVTRTTEGKPYRNHFTITAKGWRVIASELDRLDKAAAAEAAQPKPKRARKPKGEAAPAPQGEAPQGEMPASDHGGGNGEAPQGDHATA